MRCDNKTIRELTTNSCYVVTSRYLAMSAFENDGECPVAYQVFCVIFVVSDDFHLYLGGVPEDIADGIQFTNKIVRHQHNTRLLIAPREINTRTNHGVFSVLRC